MTWFRDRELERLEARRRYGQAELERLAQREETRAPEVGARLAVDEEVCRGAAGVRKRAEGAGWRVAAVYARGWARRPLRCDGGLAMPLGEESGGAWGCPSCGRAGAVTKWGAIRTHGARGSDGAVVMAWTLVETLSLRMAHVDGRRAVAVWWDGGLDGCYSIRPILARITLGQLQQLIDGAGEQGGEQGA